MHARIPLSLALSLWAASATAQTNTRTENEPGNIIGLVIDADSRQPVADVVITATSPELQGEQVVVTTTEGTYRLSQLPPGVYTLRFEKEQYLPYERSEVMLRPGRTLRVDVEPLPAQRPDYGCGCGCIIDVSSSSTGLTVDQEFIRRIAIH
ncbi:carboxypeptidase-like regulatory domain-containing protein [Myxococcus stipitatus]|uniref:carboxypeptidase-like regulatory domain-containing protein n=1 Tax=Myxococcus stipitatus TaxID=83455 RepID=UPI001F3678E4|nr:carboxypeptidase-like regulatory domain-containing protein [Myxococcus stipitatus]MCE9668369.1 carboxypeptidase-like regulatory domain-containing protein [Myxococcus stipitatus]